MWLILFNIFAFTLQGLHVGGYLIIEDRDCSLKQRMDDLETQFAMFQENMNRHINHSVTHAKTCPDGWLVYQGSCYFFGNESISFDQAKAFCARHSAYVAHIDNAVENALLSNLLKAFSAQVYVWIGLTDTETEGIWKWYDDNTKATFLDWGATEPQNLGGGAGEDCAVISYGRGYMWADVPCNYPCRALCEKRVDAPQT